MAGPSGAAPGSAAEAFPRRLLTGGIFAFGLIVYSTTLIRRKRFENLGISAQLDTAQIRFREIAVAECGSSEIGVLQVGSNELNLFVDGRAQIASGQLCVREIDLDEIIPTEA
jgi:hypothetical protein